MKSELVLHSALLTLHCFRWAEVDRLSSNNKEGVPSVAKALAVRVRFPALECLHSIAPLVHLITP